MYCYFFFFKQKTAYEMRISDWSSDVCSSDLFVAQQKAQRLRNGDSVERNNLRRLYHSERGVNAVLVDGSNFFREDKGAKAGMDALRARVADLPKTATLITSHNEKKTISREQIRRAWCRGNVCQYVWIAMVAGSY